MIAAFFKSTAGGLASIRLTVVLLVLSILLVFAATLDQVHLGVWGVQEKYFHSFFVFTTVAGTQLTMPVFPGGYLLGGVLLANLLAAHFTRFRLAWKNCGIWLTHIGLILLLIGEGVSGLWQRDSQMRLDVGQTKRYAESFRETELAVVDATDPAYDDVVAIPSVLVEEKSEIQHPRLPFTLRAAAYYPNAVLSMRSAAPNAPAPAATIGDGTDIAVQPVPVTYKPNENNFPTALIDIRGADGPVGTVLVSTLLVSPQTFTYQGRNWRIELRAKRDYFPVAVTLLKFTHAVYPGTDIPKDFASTVRLHSDDGRDDRQVRIYMNNPLRFAGRAFYQAGYDNNDRTSVLQVVHNPAWTIPYVACGLIGLGLAVQFLIHLLGFVRRRAKSVARAKAPKPSPSAPPANPAARPAAS
jgi:hypothetical protein